MKHDDLCRHGNSVTVAVVTTEGEVLPAFTEDEFDECWECDLIAKVREDERLTAVQRVEALDVRTLAGNEVYAPNFKLHVIAAIKGDSDE